MSSSDPNRKEEEEGRKAEQRYKTEKRVLPHINTEHGPKAMNNLVNTSALFCSKCVKNFSTADFL